MDNDKQQASTRLAVAIIGSALIIGASTWVQYKFFPHPEAQKKASVISADQQQTSAQPQGTEVQKSEAPVIPKPSEPVRRIEITGEKLQGSLNLRGAVLDDLVSLKYKETLDKDSPHVRFLSAQDSSYPTYVTIGWNQLSENASTKLPNLETVWQSSDNELKAGGNPILLTWDNGEGVNFKIKISLDKQYMFNIQQEVENNSNNKITLQSYQTVHRDFLPKNAGSFTEYLGPIGAINAVLKDIGYKDIKKNSEATGGLAWSDTGSGGWGGITDKYWLVAAGAQKDQKVTLSYKHQQSLKESGDYLVSLTSAPSLTDSQTESSTKSLVFVGPKDFSLLSAYQKQYSLDRFDSAIDFGWFSFLTRPILWVLHWLYGLIGNFGLALMALTVIVKILLFPLASKAAVSAARMKLLAPKMAELKKKYSSDPKAMNQQMMALYREEKVHPAGGCLPILIQAPIFFCLYKMLNISLDERQAPFFGWIKDLSVPDPTNIFNLFGLLPFNPTVISPFLHVSLWGLALGFTFWMMQKQTMVSMDPAQARIMQFMPLVYVFIMSDFPAGLLIYYTWNNILTYLQQAYIQRRTVLPVPVKGGVIEGKK
ncbi:membrane protein insertase YidC [Acetobacteraceae bacterium]|nr:membrane protein insertase YidC [Acetobacteraceae bacterium]